MEFLKPYIRGLMLQDFKNGLKAADSTLHINSAFGKDTVSERTARDWLARFCTGDHDVENWPRSGRPSGFHDENLR